MNAPPPVEPTGAPPEFGERGRSTGAIVWSGFLAASIATMICFAFVDPEALRSCYPPKWWTTRLNVYALGFFLFWLTGLVGAGLCWLLARSRTRHG